MLRKIARLIFKKPFHKYHVGQKVEVKTKYKEGIGTVISRDVIFPEYCIMLDSDIDRGHDFWAKEDQLKVAK